VLDGGDAERCDEHGGPLLVVRRGAVAPAAACRAVLRRAAKGRGYGSFAGLRTGSVGFWEPGRWPYPRASPFTRDDPEGWAEVCRLFLELDRVYRAALPDVYADQRRYAGLIHPDWRVPGTAFTAGTVNATAEYHPHRHGGNLALGVSVMAVFRRGAYTGGLFVLPEYRVAVDARDRDVILFRSDALHGNTPFAGVPGAYERLSLVAYCRRRLLGCGSAKAENAKANRVSSAPALVE
jgi:hypothetical protein